MKPEEIKKRINKVTTQTAIGKSLNPPVSQSAVNQVIAKRQVSKRIQNKICEVIGETWGDVFGKD